VTAPVDNETWIIERGADIIEKKERSGLATLDDWEHLVYCLWIADYMMRNAGDLANAPDLYPEFQVEAIQRARRLGLVLTERMFALPPDQFEREYLDQFESVCGEVRSSDAA
jgi:hypothetical protein